MREWPSLIGEKFGMLTVIGQAPSTAKGQHRWICRCDCGIEKIVLGSNLKRGTTVSCGCKHKNNLTGQRIGKLTVIGRSDKYGSRGKRQTQLWECLCDCGNTVLARATLLASGHTTSCGCVKRELDEQKDFRKILTYTDDTCIEFAKGIGKPRSNTSSDTGVRGVILKDGKYQAQIKFRKKRHYLGRFSRLEDAVEARRRAEMRVEEYVEEYLAGNPSPSIRIDL